MGRPFEDAYFNNEDGVLAVYDFDYEAATDFSYKLSTRSTLMIASIIPYCWPVLPFVAGFVFSPMFHDNVKEKIEAQHLAVTRDGIKYVVERHKTGCRFDCQDVGKVSKTVPYDKITDCDVEEPAGSSGPCCCLVENVLHVVNVDTASGSRGEGNSHELTLAGLKDPHQFKKDVWSMKRGEGVAASPNSTGKMVAPDAATMSDRLDAVMASDNKSLTGKGPSGLSPNGEQQLLGMMKEQNKLLQDQNKILQAILEK